MLKKRYAYNDENLLEYEGFALPGTSEDAEGWLIKKFTYDANKNPIKEDIAGGEAIYNKKWTERETYTYS